MSEKVKINAVLSTLMGIGVLTLGVGLNVDGERTWRAYLLYNMLFLGLGLGAFLFLVFHYLASSGWFVLVRRIPEAMTTYLKVGAITTFVLILGVHSLYPWSDHMFMEADHFLHHKSSYFHVGFWFTRVVLFFAVILFFSYKMVSYSLCEDVEGGSLFRQKQKPLAAVFLVLFAPTFTIFAVDMIKSLEPKWFSTIFGVYIFTGFMQSSMAAIILILSFLKKKGFLAEVREDHVHDLGKYLFGWTVFWGYISFSQYMLIWYANLPEETFYFINREKGTWLHVGIALLATKFILPFLLLLPRRAKRSMTYLCCISSLVLFSQWLDLHWMIMPSYSPQGFTVSWQDLGCFLGFLGLFIFAVRSFLIKYPMTPQKDPYLHESKKHHVLFA